MAVAVAAEVPVAFAVCEPGPVVVIVSDGTKAFGDIVAIADAPLPVAVDVATPLPDEAEFADAPPLTVDFATLCPDEVEVADAPLPDAVDVALPFPNEVEFANAPLDAVAIEL